MEQQTPCMNNSRDGQWALISSHLIIKLISRIILQSPFSEAIPLTLCMLGNFAYFLFSADLLFFLINFFKKYFSLDPDPAKHLPNMYQNVCKRGRGGKVAGYYSARHSREDGTYWLGKP